jgi:hypothetical protein
VRRDSLKVSRWNFADFLCSDIDGDGRADYCLIGDDGFTRCWRNGGFSDGPAYWEYLGIVFTPKGKGDIRGTRFIDLNGDGRSDWIVSSQPYLRALVLTYRLLVGW